MTERLSNQILCLSANEKNYLSSQSQLKKLSYQNNYIAKTYVIFIKHSDDEKHFSEKQFFKLGTSNFIGIEYFYYLGI